jgi:hypothetical protein
MNLVRRIVLLAVVGVAAAHASGQPAQPPASKAAPAMPAGVKAFAALNVAEVWDHRAFGPVREARGKLEFAWAVQSMVGLAPAELDRFVLFWHPSVPDLPFAAVVGRKAVDAAAVAKTLSRPGARGERPLGGKAIPVAGGEFAFVYPVDAKTLLLAPTGADRTKLDAIAALLPAVQAAAGKHALAVGVDVAALEGLPLPIGGPLVEARTAVATIDLERDTAVVRLTATYPTPDGAKAAAPILTAKFQELAGYAKAQQKKAEARPSEANAYTAPLLEFVAKTMTDARVRTDGAALVGSADVKLDEAVGRVLMALPDGALSPRGPSAAEANLRQIGIALHSYHDVYSYFPGNIYAKDGTALLSWRVQLLPYMEQEALFNRFKRDEAWDSPANKDLSQTVVRTFQVPGRPTTQPWETYFRTFTSPKRAEGGRGWLEDGNPKGVSIASITDGTSNTFMVVEAAEAVPWAKPDDLPFDAKNALPRLGGPSGSFAALFGDGSTRTFRRSALNDATLRGAITINGGEAINLPDR